MRLLFWISFLTVFYTYAGYAIFLSILARLRPRAVLRQPITPTVSILIAARNEEGRIEAKIENLRELNYPRNLLEIIVVSDGSTDNTVALLEKNADLLHPLIFPSPFGKAFALNHARAKASGEILVFFDVRQIVDTNAIKALVSYFSDPNVGAVSGELVLRSTVPGSTRGLGIYWKIEKMVRQFESATGSVVGATGAIYAIRKDLYRDLPPNTILDDVLIPMNVARLGKRVMFCQEAIAYDQIFKEESKEFSRKVRTLMGNLQMLKFAPWLLTRRNPLLFRLISHKLLRLIAPFFLLLMLLSAAAVHSPLYVMILILQLIFYGLAVMGSARPSTCKWKTVAIAHTFVILNLAALVAVRNFIIRRTHVWN
jgi:biofilm PGA synthesis N-glycosyltransferase PgaC